MQHLLYTLSASPGVAVSLLLRLISTLLLLFIASEFCTALGHISLHTSVMHPRRSLEQTAFTI